MTSPRDNLHDWLEMVVPLRMVELRDRSAEELAALGRAQTAVIASRGDVLQFGGRGAAQAAAALATGLAALALTSEGGVTFGPLHWCSTEHADCPSRPALAHLGPRALPVPVTPTSPRPVQDIPLPGPETLQARLADSSSAANLHVQDSLFEESA
ncbi:hypothetical protein [uncultured Thermomonospora sp.]|uniref:hypothetical protein n=1 Tax=uncultured Thermomonospora sp. TaxID=671175 RepID=UPI00259BA37B|nr:hypothetical protein [uncultured Thermomonospora sp.]